MKRLGDLHRLPKFRDALSFLYLERGRIEQDAKSVAFWDAGGMTAVPAAAANVLLLGPGIAITHAALLQLADNNVLSVFMGEGGVRYYCHGWGGTRSAERLIRQAALASASGSRIRIARRMYNLRFSDRLDPSLSMDQLRGMEGRRMRDAYHRAAEATGVPWERRDYNRTDWGRGNAVNRALSAANSCLYGVCHAAVLSLGYSPALGFLHTGKQLSFVYDIADFYKTRLTIPLAFELARGMDEGISRAARLACRDEFHRLRILKRIVRDIQHALEDPEPVEAQYAVDADPALPTPLWDPPVAEDGP